MKLLLVLSFLLVLVSSIGAYYLNTYTPYIVLLVVWLVPLVIYYKLVPESYYSLVILAISLALVLQTSMLGTYVVGNDIFGELRDSRWVTENGFSTSTGGGNGTVLVTTVLAPALDSLGIPLVWQFKLLYPILLSFVPLLLYLLYRKYFSTSIAFYSAYFILIAPMFVLETTGHAKGMTAQFSYAALLLVLFGGLIWFKKTILALSLVSLVVICHYYVGAWCLLVLLGTIILLLVFRYLLSTKQLAKVPTILLVVVFVVGCITTLVWNYQFSSNKIYSYRSIALGIASSNEASTSSSIASSNEASNRTSTSLFSRLEPKDPMVRAAIGLDFFEIDLVGKIFRLAQFFIQFLFILGLVSLFLVRIYKTIAIDYLAFTTTCFGLLVIAMFLPSFTDQVNITRLYQLSLFGIAPLLVIGSIQFTRGFSTLWQKVL